MQGKTKGEGKYQSNKYNQPTATSEAVIVTLENNTDFEIKQTVADEFRVVFNGAVDALKKEDVTVELIDAVNSNFKVPCLIESVTLADDKKSATVKLYTQFTDAAMYKVTVKDVDRTFVASNGLPVDIKMSINQYNPDDVIVPAGTAHPLYVSFYDAAGVLLKMGSNAPTVYLSTDQYDKCLLGYEDTSNTILFTEAGATATINATCSGYIGNTEINIKKDFTFYSRVPDPVYVTVVKKEVQWRGGLKTTYDDWDAFVLEVHYSDKWPGQKEAITNEYDKDGNLVTPAFNRVYDNGRYMFKLVALNPDVAVIDDNMHLNKFIAPSGNDIAAGFILKAVTKDANGAWTVETPVDVINIQITKTRALNSVTVDKTLVSVGNTSTSEKQVINLIVKDQYGANFVAWASNITSTQRYTVELECLDNYAGAKAAVHNEVSVDLSEKNKDNSGMGRIIVTYGPNLEAVLNEINKDSVQLRYRLTVKSKEDSTTKSVTFSIRVKKFAEGTTSDVVTLEITDGGINGNVGRYTSWTDSSKDAKTCTIQAFRMKDGLRLREQDVNLYTKNVTAADEGKYYIQLMKNNQDVTDKGYITMVSGSSVKIDFSQMADIPGAVSGSTLYGAKKVTYDLGAGNIAVYLWKVDKQGNLNRVSTAPIMGTTTVDTGKYNGYKRKYETIASDGVSQESVRACFEVYNRDGQNSSAAYIVDYRETNGYVFVERIRFYESLEYWCEVEQGVYEQRNAGQYAEYVVDINESLKKN